jgi:Ser/Thr protein kinase RdoA (MazF antagonist)
MPFEASVDRSQELASSPLTPSGPQREFERLPRRTQVRRMRRLAEAALSDYNLPDRKLTLLAHLFNTTFRVDAADGRRYVLRIHRAGTPTVDTVGSEMAWLEALRRDTLLEVPSPVPTRSGKLLTVASTPGVPNPHICVLFRLLPGTLRRNSLTPGQMKRVGEFMAQLHLHARRWERPPGFTRGRVDWPVEGARWASNPFAPEVVAYCRDLVSETLSPAEAGPVAEVLERVREAEEQLRRRDADGPPTFGLIHADLHYGNLLFSGLDVRAIDFDDCGFGPLLYDHAVMLSAVLGWPNYSALREGLLAGYSSVCPLPTGYERLLDLFIALRQVQDGLWALEYRVHPALGEDWAAAARQSLAPLPGLLAGRDG